MIKNRTLSFFILLVVYIIATLGGYIVYNSLSFNYLLSLLLADVVATVIVFVFSLIFRNASVYDPYWSVQPIVIVIFYGFSSGLNLLGILLVAAISYWAIRLTGNWAYTFQNLTCQDWRYTMLKEKTGIFYPLINFIGIHMVPTLIVYACTIPAVIAIKETIAFTPIAIPFIALSFIAPTIQLIADIQMHTFRSKKQKGIISGPEANFIRNGLWKHARHPNYFGEILMWWGIGLAVVISSPENWKLISGAVLNTILFLSVSIPMADKRQSKKPGFAEYKKETRILI